jgi:hypothetical protein
LKVVLEAAPVTAEPTERDVALVGHDT